MAREEQDRPPLLGSFDQTLERYSTESDSELVAG